MFDDLNILLRPAGQGMAQTLSEPDESLGGLDLGDEAVAPHEKGSRNDGFVAHDVSLS